MEVINLIVCPRRNQMTTVTAGFYADDTLGEVFIGIGKSGTDAPEMSQ